MEAPELSTHLPAEPNRFIGREQELDELRQALRQTRALTLCGAGGIGKTRLAMRLIARVADDFPDGICLVELGDVWEADLVVPRLAALLGVDEEPGRAVLGTLTDALEDRQVLIVLDNCEHLADACAALCQQLLAHCPGLRVLATSQEPLRIPPESVWQVAPLSLPPLNFSPARAEHLEQALARYEAVRLFADRAAEARPGFTITERNAAAVASICCALDGVPLAIELAAARVAMMSPEQIAERLSDRFALLCAGSRTAPPRQRTLRATIDWSHDLLSVAEQILLRRLSVFAGWSLEMAEQICADSELPRDDIIDVTLALVDKSLVFVEPEESGRGTRYRLLDSIRAYAAQRLAEASESAAMQTGLRDYLLELSERARAVGMALVPASWSAAVEGFRRYDVEAGNLRQVLNRCIAMADVETGLRICTSVQTCWITRGYFDEGEEWFARLLGIGAVDVAPQVRGAALIARAQLALANEPVRAQLWAREGLELCRKARDLGWTASALNLLASTELQAGSLREARACAAEALQLARIARDGWNEGYALGTQATLAAARGQLREAKQLGEQALAVMRSIDQQFGVARTLLGLGALARRRGDPASALACFSAALPALREIDSFPDIARCLGGIGLVALDQGQLPAARENLTESLRLSRATGDRIGTARGLEAFAALTAAEGHADLPVMLTAAAAALRKAAGIPPLSAERTERYLAPAQALGGAAVSTFWEYGSRLTPETAVAMALDVASQDGGGPATVQPGSPQASPSAPDGLTPREHEIAGFIVRGHTNRGIAGELVISPATVARHVANILAKLGFTSRAQIAAWAAGNGSVQPPAAQRPSEEATSSAEPPTMDPGR